MELDGRAVGPLVARLERRIRAYGVPTATVAFSGGVDSATVLALAVRALGRDAVTAATAVSPSYPEGELEQARRLAAGLGVEHQVLATTEVEAEAYARNDSARCFHCKTILYAALHSIRNNRLVDRGGILLAGTNRDDTGDFRPGVDAGSKLGVRSPLLEEGVGKTMVRTLARHLGLDVADKPALACLSSRVAYGIRIDPALLGRIDRAEQYVRELGFDQVRVRHFGIRAAIEVPSGDIPALMAHARLAELIEHLRSLGWDQVEVDPRGYRVGRMNEQLRHPRGHQREESPR
jgi:uncharacterized protein